MKRCVRALLPLLCVWMCVPPLSGQDNGSAALVKKIQKKLRGLPEFGAFDWLTFRMDGVDVHLEGFASRASVSQQAERAIQTINGVETVSNSVEVLPAGQNDQRIRSSVYASIYGHSALQRRYAPAGGTRRLSAGELRQAQTFGLESTHFARGSHAIHIIVKNGNVILLGTVKSGPDKQLVEQQAKQVSGVFTVTNQLQIN